MHRFCDPSFLRANRWLAIATNVAEAFLKGDVLLWTSDSRTLHPRKMPSDLDRPLELLRPHCSIAGGASINGWLIDVWILSEEACVALGDAYNALLTPEIPDAVLEGLRDDNIDIDTLLTATGIANETITRSDMTELAAAASLVISAGAVPEMMLLPNVPKGQRNISERGIDIIVAHLGSSPGGSELHPDDHLTLCSVKHTVTDVGDLRYKLVKSLNLDALNTAYVVSQCRLLRGRLKERGIEIDRLMLAIGETARGAHLRIVGVAVADVTMGPDLLAEMQNLPAVTGWHLLRRVLIPSLNQLHMRAST
jgi:hypothetical protein